MVCKYYGKNVPVFPVRPEYLLTTDDTVEYIFEGKGQEQDQFRLCSTKSLKKLELGQSIKMMIQITCVVWGSS